MKNSDRSDIYGYRARIGYTSPPAATEVFPYEFYKTVPKGVTLVISTLAISERSKEEIDRSYDMSLKAAHDLARAEIDILVLGGVPINVSKGYTVDDLIRDVESKSGVPVTTSITAQTEALRTVGAQRVAIGHPFMPAQNDTFASYLHNYGFKTASVQGADFKGHQLGMIPRATAVKLARACMEEDSSADTLWLPCPHWAVIDSIDAIESEFGINVITAHQAITWHALRRCGVNDRIDGVGRLMREF